MLATPSVHASVDLIATGSLSGQSTDLSTENSALLENGAPGNLLGGIGSGIAYAGCKQFLAIPDRGANAIPYNAGVSDTASYLDRFQTISMDLEPSAPGSALPFALTPTLVDTTLLRTAQQFAYGSGVDFGLPGCAPALNSANHTHYFTGRSDNFDASRLSTNPLDACMDPGSIRVTHDGSNVFVTDEYGPYIYRFNRKPRQRTTVIVAPDAFGVANLSANGDDESAQHLGPRREQRHGRLRDFAGRHGPVRRHAEPLLRNGGTNAPYTRILRIDLETGETTQYTYQLTNIGSVSNPKYPTISEVVAVNDHELLADERDGKGLGDGSTASFKKLFHIDLTGAQDVSALTGATALAP